MTVSSISFFKIGPSLALALLIGSANEPLRLLPQPPHERIPPSYFGMHIHRIAVPAGIHVPSIPWPTVLFGEWRLWDARVNWPYLEPKKGTWDFNTLDRIVYQAEERGVGVLLPLGLSPAWASSRPAELSAYAPGWAAEPRNLDDWREYVRTVAERYKGRIRYYEIWNEANYPRFYSGTTDSLVQLAGEAYRILKEVDPGNTVVSPSGVGGKLGTRWLDAYLSKGGGAHCDIVGFHFYVSPKPPEAMIPVIQEVKALLLKHRVEKPLWNTETGYYIENQLTDVDAPPQALLKLEQASAYIARAYIINWALGIKRLYWYSWDNYKLGLTEYDGTRVKKPAIAYGVMRGWLLGSKMEKLNRNQEGTWTCHLVDQNAVRKWIVWNPDAEVEMKVPDEWRVKKYWSLSGHVITAQSSTITDNHTKTRSVRVTGMPLLLESEK